MFGGDLKRRRALEDEFLKPLKLADAEELKEGKSSSQAADSLIRLSEIDGSNGLRSWNFRTRDVEC